VHNDAYEVVSWLALSLQISDLTAEEKNQIVQWHYKAVL